MRLLLVSISLLLCITAVGQQRPPRAQMSNEPKSKKAAAIFREGLNQYQQGKFQKAEEMLKMVIEREPEYAGSYMMLGEVYRRQDKNEEAVTTWKKCLEVNPDSDPNVYFGLGESLIKLGRYTEAKKYTQQFLQFEQISPKSKYKAKQNLRNCAFAEVAIQNPVPFDPKNLGEGVNSSYPEYFPSISADMETLLYTRRVPSKQNFSGYNEDFYQSTWLNDHWGKSKNLGQPINSIYNEGAPTFSADGRLIIFTACEMVDGYGGMRKGYGSCDLFITQKKGSQWLKPKNLGPAINTNNWETQPTFGADGKTLYFIRGPRGVGQNNHNSDIFMSTYTKGKGWSRAKRLGSNVNTPMAEASVFVHPDGNSLYFASEGHDGFGGQDLFVTHKDAEGNWGKPQNLGYPINTNADENSLQVLANGKLALFASDREGGFGDLDLYSFELPEKARAIATTYFKGRVFDIETKASLEAEFELIDLATGKQVAGARSDGETGEFLVALPGGREYALNASAPGYLFYSENFDLPQNLDKPTHKDVPMQPIKPGAKMVLKNVFFETSKFDLKPKSKVELNQLIAFMRINKSVKVLIGGHTDNQGGTAENQVLSENRANAVKAYLVDKGIDETRLRAKGYGPAQPIATNDTEEGRAQNRRTEFEILE